MFLARKITHAKWKRQDLLPHLTSDEISADAVTADLRTSEDSLSLWRCGKRNLPKAGLPFVI